MLLAFVVSLAIVLFIGPVLFARLRLGKAATVTSRWVNPYDPDGGYKRDVLSVIEGARTHLTMVRGEIPFTVYDEEIGDALRRAHRRGVGITLVCGPVVVVPDTGSRPTLCLADQKILNLYYAERPLSPHFVEADGETLYWEAPHPAGAAERQVYFIAHSQFQADRWHKRTLAAIREERAVGVESLRERFVLLPPAEFEALTKRLDAENLSLDELSGEDIRRLIGKG